MFSFFCAQLWPRKVCKAGHLTLGQGWIACQGCALDFKAQGTYSYDCCFNVGQSYSDHSLKSYNL